MSETQESIAAWCREHYPDEDLHRIVSNLVEEVAELAAALHLDTEGLAEHFRRSGARPQSETISMDEVSGEVGDVEISLSSLADFLGLQIGAATDAKMAVNRRRDPAASKARRQAKRAFGL